MMQNTARTRTVIWLLVTFLAIRESTARKKNRLKFRKDQPHEVVVDTGDQKIQVVIQGINKVNPPDDPGGLGCADVQIVLDLSCSISRKMKIKSRDIAKVISADFLSSFDPSIGLKVRVGIIVYAETVRQILPLDNNMTNKEVVDILGQLNLTKHDEHCRTMTHLALEEARTILSTNKRRNDAQIIYLFTDGLTFYRRHRKKLYQTKDKLTDEGVILNVVRIPHRKNEARHIMAAKDEFDKLPHHLETNIFNGTDPDVANAIVDQFKKDAPCQQTA
ncbi:unnamed protein product [Owenia fusiformis]|uniref:Uncharacterized protein n=1 Tax=Owenia fusiformis TaxID=6347 RepID=A0A8J1XNV2_OWEFU|nr:unnamed protein product [Owenia fusiformis]